MIKRMLGVILGALVILGIIAGCTQDESEPMSAENMKAEQRAANDVAVLLEELSSLGAEKVEINYARDAIKVYLAKESTAQYVSDDAGEVESGVNEALADRRGDLTLEKESYHVYIYGKDGRLITP